MEQRAGVQISMRAFIQSLVILFVLMLLAGVLTLIVPAGRYERVTQAGRELIAPDSFRYVERPAYPIWRWITAPLETLWGPDGLTIITILLFLLMVGAAFAVLERGGILRAALARLVSRFGRRKYVLLLATSLFFMLLGAFFGIFEEVVPLVPLIVALAYFLGWDALVGLGMSILATNLGFSAAISNPFTIGVAQQIAGLPLFSGAWFRLLIFVAVYAVFAVFLVMYARRIDREPAASLLFAADGAERARYREWRMDDCSQEGPGLKRALLWFLAFLVLILAVLMAGPLLPMISRFALPLVGVLFLIGGVGAGLLAGCGLPTTLKSLGQGAAGVAPGVPLILMAASVKHIVAQGGIMDTLLHSVSAAFLQAGPLPATLMIFVLALFIEFFVSSGSAKAFLLMPILLPLADLVGVTRQIAVTAYCFGDGFSNLAYPTNPVLLISLGLTIVSYPQWLRWTLKLWLWLLPVTLAFLALAVAIGFGPF